jgi:beta-lactamase class A
VLRTFAATIAAPAIVACGGGGSGSTFAQSTPAGVSSAMADFARMAPQTSSALVRVEAPTGTWSSGHNVDTRVFIASSVKTFILAQFLRDVEAGRDGLTGNMACEVSDQFRTLGAPVLGNLTGTFPYRSALEAMIAHSDNMATDIVLAKVDPVRVRALIAQAGLTQTQIPTSTRRLFSYLAGAPIGTDLGWEAIRRVANNESLGLASRKDVINVNESMVSTSSDMVAWYQKVLAGALFQERATTREFKRISSMANALWVVVPEDVISYGKGGSIDWEDFHALSLAGQMLVLDVPVTFNFTLNWTGGTLDSNTRLPEFGASVARVLAQVNTALRGG